MSEYEFKIGDVVEGRDRTSGTRLVGFIFSRFSEITVDVMCDDRVIWRTDICNLKLAGTSPSNVFDWINQEMQP